MKYIDGWLSIETKQTLREFIEWIAAYFAHDFARSHVCKNNY